MCSSIFLQVLTPARIASFLLLVIVGNCIANHFKPGLRNIPGPFLASLTNLWRLIDVKRGNHQSTLIKLHRKYGTKLLRIAPNVVSVSDPDAVKVLYGIKLGFTKVSSNKELRNCFKAKFMF